MYGRLVLSMAMLGNDGTFVGGIAQRWLDHGTVSSEGINAGIKEWGRFPWKWITVKEKACIFSGFLSACERHLSHSLTPHPLIPCDQM